jgi:2-keto-4-pentenoate hydratase
VSARGGLASSMTTRGLPRAEADGLAAVLARARVDGKRLATLAPELQPADSEAAYAAQYATLQQMGAAPAGWKIGSKSHDGPIQGAPLPAACVYRGPTTLARDAYAKPALELEIAFAFGRRFEAGSGPYSDETVLEAIATMHATIEVVASRFEAWPNVDKLWQLADLQNHGALIVGEGVAYERGYPFVAPRMQFTFDGANIIEGKPANTAGDPRRLLPWLVNHCVSRGVTIEPGAVLTCGSYTGMHFPASVGVALGAIEGLPPVELTFARTH